MLNFIFDSSQHICLFQRKNSARRNARLELGFFLSDMGKFWVGNRPMTDCYLQPCGSSSSNCSNNNNFYTGGSTY